MRICATIGVAVAAAPPAAPVAAAAVPAQPRVPAAAMPPAAYPANFVVVVASHYPARTFSAILNTTNVPPALVCEHHAARSCGGTRYV